MAVPVEPRPGKSSSVFALWTLRVASRVCSLIPVCPRAREPRPQPRLPYQRSRAHDDPSPNRNPNPNHPTLTRYNAGVIPGFTTVAQVEACVEAFKLEPLPAALNEEIDAIHERYRNPCATYANKELVQTAPWLEDAMRPKEEL